MSKGLLKLWRTYANNFVFANSSIKQWNDKIVWSLSKMISGISSAFCTLISISTKVKFTFGAIEFDKIEFQWATGVDIFNLSSQHTHTLNLLFLNSVMGHRSVQG